MTTAAMTQVSTTPRTTQIQVLTLPATGCPGELPRVSDADRIPALFAEGLASRRVGGGASAVSARERDAAQFDGGTAADPQRRVLARRDLEILRRRVGTPPAGAGGAALVAPQRLFAGNAFAGVRGEHGQSFRQGIVSLF